MPSLNGINPSTNLSESQKKSHVKALNQDLQLTSDGNYNSDIYHDFIENSVIGFDKSFVITPVPLDDVRFGPALRSSLSKVCGNVQNYFYKAAEFHNTMLVGMRAIDKEFDAPLMQSYTELVREGFAVMKKAADFLVSRFLRSGPYDGFNKFSSEVMVELEVIIFRKEKPRGCYLQAVLEPVVDYLARSVQLRLLDGCIRFSDDANRPVRYNSNNPAPLVDQNIQNACSLYFWPHFYYQNRHWEERFDYYRANLPDSVSPFNADDSVDMLAQIVEIIPYFIKGWDATKHEFKLTDETSVYIDIGFGQPRIYTAASGIEQSHALKANCTPYVWDMFTGKFAWELDLNIDSDDMQAVGAYILQRTFDLFVELFSKVRLKPAPALDHLPQEMSYEQFAVASYSAFERMIEDPDDINAEPTHHRISFTVPSLRISKFLSIIQKQHGCFVEPGKGSEIKIWRPGTHIFTIGRHKRNPCIPTRLIRVILKRLEINEQDWLVSLGK